MADDEWDHYQAADDAYQGAYRLRVDHGDCLDLAVDVARKPLLAEIERLKGALDEAYADLVKEVGRRVAARGAESRARRERDEARGETESIRHAFAFAQAEVQRLVTELAEARDGAPVVVDTTLEPADFGGE